MTLRWLSAPWCDKCNTAHSNDVMCAPHEVRPWPRLAQEEEISWLRDALAEATKEIERMQALFDGQRISKLSPKWQELAKEMAANVVADIKEDQANDGMENQAQGRR